MSIHDYLNIKDCPFCASRKRDEKSFFSIISMTFSLGFKCEECGASIFHKFKSEKQIKELIKKWNMRKGKNNGSV